MSHSLALGLFLDMVPSLLESTGLQHDIFAGFFYYINYISIKLLKFLKGLTCLGMAKNLM